MAKANLTKTANVNTTAREIDFVSRFANNWESLREILGVSRLIRKPAGTDIKVKKAQVTLANGAVGEGEEIPYSQSSVTETSLGTIAVQKYAKAVSIEAINDHGYNDAVNRTDEEFLYELQNKVTEGFFTFLEEDDDALNPGIDSETSDPITMSSFQMALAKAQGLVRNKFKEMGKGITDVIGFCNILDAYDYLGAANIDVQNEFGMNYIENFIGYKKLFLCSDSEVESGTIYATPAENVIIYYVSPDDSDFAKAGLAFTTDGETPLIGFHVQGNYTTAVSESFALMGMKMVAEYEDGIAKVPFTVGA